MTKGKKIVTALGLVVLLGVCLWFSFRKASEAAAFFTAVAASAA